MSYQIEVYSNAYQIEIKNGNDSQIMVAAYIVKARISGYNYFLTAGLTDAEIVAKRELLAAENQGIYTYSGACTKAFSIVSSEVNRASVLEVWADAANAILHTAIAEQADLQNEANKVADIFAELDLVPENACEDIALEALIAGSAFDNAEPTPAFSLHYEMPTNLYDLDELSNVIAEEEWRALGTVDAEISALKAKLIQLNDKRIGIVEECAHWRGKCERAIEIAEYEQNYDSNEAQADLRQSIWQATGQDIM